LDRDVWPDAHLDAQLFNLDDMHDDFFRSTRPFFYLFDNLAFFFNVGGVWDERVES
jgi:hypothetical protein